MYKKLNFWLIFCIVFGLIACGDQTPENNRSPINIRIGWQTTWATQGQITKILDNTNILTSNGLVANFVGATYGGPLNEAALAGNVDVIFTADQPAATLIARNPDWVIIGRLMFNRVALYVPPFSPIKTIADLKGKTIDMPFGAAAQRIAIKAIANSGLNPKTDVKTVNLDITEQPAIILKGTNASWGDVDAMAGFDPTVALFETNKHIRNLVVENVTAVIVMSKKYITANPGAPVKFLKSFKQASFYYAKNIHQANEWFRKSSQASYTDEVLDLAASVEPNTQAKSLSDVNITFTPQQLTSLQEAADFLYQNQLIKQQIQISNNIDQSFATKANEELANQSFDVNSFQILKK